MTDILLYELPELYKSIICKRPSKHIKSPYVADISLSVEGQTNKIINNTKTDKTNKTIEINETNEYLGHTPSLGCCGLAEKDSIVLVSKLVGEKTKCDFRVELSELQTKGHSIVISVAPKLAEYITYNALKKNLINGIDIKTVLREKKLLHSRFDFMGRQTNDDFYILEVKNVPLADYVDMEEKEKKKMNFDNYEWNDKISYFPDGYRKKKGDVVSERALKHINELREIKEKEPRIRCILLFVIPRIDVKWFQVSRLDPTYLNAVREAWKKGVEIKTLQVEWRETINENGPNGYNCYFYNNHLPVMLFDDYNHMKNHNIVHKYNVYEPKKNSIYNYMDDIETLIRKLSYNYTNIIPRDRLKNYKKLNWGNNGIGDRWANKKFNYTVIYKNGKIKTYSENENDTVNQEMITIFIKKNKHLKSGIIGIFVHSKRNNIVLNRPIRNDIKKYIKQRSCVSCGSSSDIICDHKNDMYNDKRVLDIQRQTLEDFQPLCNHCNLQKRQVYKNEVKQQKLYSAKNIDKYKVYNFDFPWEKKIFDLSVPFNKKDTYWYDPVEFNRKLQIYSVYRICLYELKQYFKKLNKKLFV